MTNQLALFGRNYTDGAVQDARFERFLRRLGVPWVAVQEASRAVFVQSGATPEAFDYLVYNSHGPNLLILMGTPTPDGVALMRQWQGMFGASFVAVFVWYADGVGEWVGALLEDLGKCDTRAMPVANMVTGMNKHRAFMDGEID